MLDPELLALLVCPDTHLDLVEANAAEVAYLNDLIRGGALQSVAGVKVTELLDGALIRADRAVAYPVRDDIPVMLVKEGINTRQVAFGIAASETARNV